MLEMLRNAGKSWVAKILLFILAASFALWGVSDVFVGYRADDVATVGDQSVTRAQYTAAYQNFKRMIAGQNGVNLTDEQAREMGIDKRILDQLIAEAALTSEADKLRLDIAPQVVVDKAKTQREFQNAQGQFDPALFQQSLKRVGLTEAGFMASQSQNLKQGAIIEAVTGDLVAPQTLQQAIYRFNNDQRDAKYFTLTLTPADVPPPSEADLKKHYEDFPSLYTAPEYRSVAIMKIDTTDVKGQIKISDDELKAAYDDQKDKLSIPDRRSFLQLSFPNLAAAQAAEKQLQSGTDFLALAKTMGATEADISFTDKTKADLLDSILRDAVFNAPLNQATAPVKGGFTTAIFKITKIEAGHEMSFDEAKPQLLQQLTDEKIQDKLQEIANAVDTARENRTTKFEDIAKSQNVKFITIPQVDARGFDANNRPVEIPAGPIVLKEAFATQAGVVNDPISTANSFIWYEVRGITPPTLKKFEAVQIQLKSDVTNRLAREALVKRGNALVEKLKKGQTLDALAAENKAEIKTLQGLKRNIGQVGAFDPVAISAVFNVAPNGFTSSVNPDGASINIIQSQPVLETPYQANSPEAKKVADNLQVTLVQDFENAYLAMLRKQNNTTINELAWQQVTGRN